MKTSMASVLALILLVQNCFAQKTLGHKTELSEPTDPEMLGKIQGQLLNALELLQVYQEDQAPALGIAPNQLKFTEKRRNKFEFIRFGRRR